MTAALLHLILALPTIVIGITVAWCILKVGLPRWLDFLLTVAASIILGNWIWSLIQ